MQETQVQSLSREDLLEKEMATHSSILAWKIPWMEDPGRLQSRGSQSWTRLGNFTSLCQALKPRPGDAKMNEVHCQPQAKHRLAEGNIQANK